MEGEKKNLPETEITYLILVPQKFNQNKVNCS